MVYKYDKANLPEPILEGHSDWIDLYYKAWKIAFDRVEYIDKKGWKPFLTCFPGVGITWQWDSCIMTFITNYSNNTITALNNLDNLYRLQRELDGFMSMAYRIETEEEAYPGRINPPLMAWSEWEHYIISGDKARLEKVLPYLEKNYNFIENNRCRSVYGLYWFEDSGSAGMDNSPRAGYPSSNLDGCDVCFIDLACQQALSAKCISAICGALDLNDKEEHYSKEQERICGLINKYHWSERAGWYFDFFIRDKSEKKVKFINSKTAAAFWSILCGAAEGQRFESVKNHLFNENEFYTKIPFASLSKDDPNYDPDGGYWLGGVWPPTNLAVIKGLCEKGYDGLAREAAIKFLDAMCKVEKDPAFGGIWEAYAPDADRPSTCENGELCRADFVGWGGIAPITLLIENIIGLSFNAPENKVTFNLFPGECGGLKNMLFNGQKVSVLCTKYVASMGQSVIEVEAEEEFTLVVKTNYLWKEVVLEVKPGKNIFKI